MNRTALLAWRYMCHYRLKTVVMVLSITVIMALPLTVHTIVSELESGLTVRARTTPLILGARGSHFDLSLHALYFKNKIHGEISMRQVRVLNESGLGEAIPLMCRFSANDYPLVGTSLEYINFRGLKIESGRGLIRLGDCLLGSRAARSLGLGAGDRLMSDPVNVFDIAGAYPLNMRVTGVLKESGTADDEAVFADIKTVWLIGGFLHGHGSGAVDTDAPSVLLEKSASNTVYNAALPQYSEVTDGNLGSFHFHGDPDDLPLTAVLVVPNSKKSETLLRGRYQDNAALQMLQPIKVVEELLGVVFSIKRFLDANLIVVALAVSMLFALVVMLSLRLRQREMEIMFMMGCARSTMFKLQLAELGIVLGISAALAVVTAGLAAHYIPGLLGV